MSRYSHNIEHHESNTLSAEEAVFGNINNEQLALFSGRELLEGVNKGLVTVGDALRQVSSDRYCRGTIESEERIALDSIGLILGELGRFPKDLAALESLRHNVSALRFKWSEQLSDT